VVTIVIVGILSSLGGMFISQPIEGYIDLERRTELVDQAEMALRRMQRDIRAALPNSVRVSTDGKRIEMLHVVDAGRYRRQVNAVGSGDVLSFTSPDASFDVLGGLQHFSEINSGSDKLIVYNLTTSGSSANAYIGDNVATVAAGSTAVSIKLNPSMLFPFSSPYQRFFIVDEAVTYFISSGQLRRCHGYSYGATQYSPISGSGDLVAKYLVLANSDFTYDTGSASRGGLVTIQLALEDMVRATGERITLLHQVHVDNAP
jgi:MSHA biogenesis protein MshO